MTPFAWPDYELLDFGDGRKLERFGKLVFDRPSPQAEGEPALDLQTWRAATAKYTGDKMTEGRWSKPKNSIAGGSRPPRTVEVPLADALAFRMQIDTLPTGQIGLFPEQLDNWRWIVRQMPNRSPLRVLNLFAYTGGSTLAAAAAGAHVTHVDASKPAVTMARENARHSGMEDAPIRWIVEDAVKYCRRELKRGSKYDAVVLDPPTYGHGPSGEDWRITRDLPRLLDLCRQLTAADSPHTLGPFYFLVTCHTPGVGPAELAAYLSDGIFGHCGQPPASGRLYLKTADGRRLESGVFARWPG